MQKIGEGKREQMKHHLCWCMRSSGGHLDRQLSDSQDKCPGIRAQRVCANMAGKLGYSMRPSRSVSGTLYPVVISYTDRLFTL